jgi:hypothetical protein
MVMNPEQSSRHPGSSTPREGQKEVRKFRRIPVEFPCLFSADGPHEWSGTVVNLSREGCAIRSTAPIAKGDYLRVLIFLSANQTPIEVGLAPVRWSANEQFGVEFITLTASDMTRLHDLLARMGG